MRWFSLLMLLSACFDGGKGPLVTWTDEHTAIVRDDVGCPSPEALEASLDDPTVTVDALLERARLVPGRTGCWYELTATGEQAVPCWPIDREQLLMRAARWAEGDSMTPSVWFARHWFSCDGDEALYGWFYSSDDACPEVAERIAPEDWDAWEPGRLVGRDVYPGAMTCRYRTTVTRPWDDGTSPTW